MQLAPASKRTHQVSIVRRTTAYHKSDKNAARQHTLELDCTTLAHQGNRPRLNDINLFVILCVFEQMPTKGSNVNDKPLSSLSETTFYPRLNLTFISTAINSTKHTGIEPIKRNAAFSFLFRFMA